MKDFADIVWLPIDIPKIPEDIVDELIEAWHLNRDPVGNIHQHELMAHTDITDWDTAGEATERWLMQNEAHLYVRDYIREYLPHYKFFHVYINHFMDDIPLHSDFGRANQAKEFWVHTQALEPCAYRIVVRGKKKGTLYLRFDDQKIYPQIPEETDCYVLRYTDGMHGLDIRDNDDPERYTLQIDGWIDVEEHKKLLLKSVEKYKDVMIERKYL